jgi:hypothetical protein
MLWMIKLIIKIIISRLPIFYATWRKLGVFRHGQMDSCNYALKIFRLHMSRCYPKGLPSSFTMLELGPGDSAASAIIGKAFGASKIYMVDIGDFAEKNICFYQKLAAKLNNQGFDVSDLTKINSFQEMLQITSAEYLIKGIESLRQIPTNSIDFIYSHSVLEHVRKKDFLILLFELNRIAKIGSFSSHCIDFQDHLAWSLNNLRFSEIIWESNLFVSSGFYTNRIPAIEMHGLFNKAGFMIKAEEFGRWPSMPIPRKSLHKSFLKYSSNDLRIRTSSILLES